MAQQHMHATSDTNKSNSLAKGFVAGNKTKDTNQTRVVHERPHWFPPLDASPRLEKNERKQGNNCRCHIDFVSRKPMVAPKAEPWTHVCICVRVCEACPQSCLRSVHFPAFPIVYPVEMPCAHPHVFAITPRWCFHARDRDRNGHRPFVIYICSHWLSPVALCLLHLLEGWKLLCIHYFILFWTLRPAPRRFRMKNNFMIS